MSGNGNSYCIITIVFQFSVQLRSGLDILIVDTDIVMDLNTTYVQDPFDTTPTNHNNSRSSENQLHIFQPWLEAVFISLYVVIFVMGVGGNLVVLYVILANKHMRTTVNIYLVNLAASDILLCLVALPLTPTSLFAGRWVFGEGEALCKLLHSSPTACVYMSTFTLTAIAVNRYRAVFYPFSAHTNTVARTILIIVCIDLSSILITLPEGVISEIVRDDHGNLYCTEKLPDGLRMVYGSFLTITQFVIPFVTIIICYTRIMFKLQQRDIEMSESMTTNQMVDEAARTSKMNKMLISIAVIFALCWLPINLFNLALDILFLTGEVPSTSFTFLIVHIIAMSSACYNPFLYGWLNTAFRAEFLKLCPLCVPAQKEEIASAESERIKLMDVE